jgi:hypothetical protein
MSSRPGRKPSPEIADRHRAIAHAHLLGVLANLLAQIHALALPYVYKIVQNAQAQR